MIKRASMLSTRRDTYRTLIYSKMIRNRILFAIIWLSNNDCELLDNPI